jgi:hypothetical protein
MTVPTVSWDETAPAGGANLAEGDDRIRELKTQIREVVDIDHKFDSSGQDADMGKHTQITMLLSGADPTAVAGEMFLYQKLTGGINEFFIRDDVGNIIQVTDGGVLNAVNLTGNETVAGEKTFSADATFSADVAIGVDLSVAGDTELTGTLDVTGAITLDGAVTLSSTFDGGATKLTNILDGVANTDAATVLQVAARMQHDIGTYLGTGVAQSITGVGFQPSIVIVYSQSTGGVVPMIKTSSDPGVYSKSFNGFWVTDHIKALDADGFSVGTDGEVNGNGITYTYIALA